MTTSATPNAAERQRWNDPAWIAGWVAREQITGSITDTVLEQLELAAGEAVLDVGSGGGALSFAAATAVAPSGRVTGVDFSVALVDLARSRAASAGLTNVQFVVADAQSDLVPDAPFDVATSQFGVMFFDDPECAFLNIGRQIAPGGRLVFACWQDVEANPWCVTPTLARYLPAPAGAGPTASETGPFAFRDPDRVFGLLGRSGWVEVERVALRRTEVVERSALVDDANALAAIAESARPEATAALEEHLARFDRGGGRFEIPLAYQIFRARRP